MPHRLTLASAALAAGCATTRPAPIVPLPSAPRLEIPFLAPDQTPQGIGRALDGAIEACDAALNRVAAVPDDERTFANTVDAIEQAVADYTDAAQRLQIWKDLHTDKAVRDAAAEAEEKSGQYLVKLAARRDLYKAVVAWQERRGKSEVLDAQQRRLVEIMLRDFRRSGMALDDAQLARLVDVRSRLATLATEFSKNLGEDLTSIEATAAELAGVPELPRAAQEERRQVHRDDQVPRLHARHGEREER